MPWNQPTSRLLNRSLVPVASPTRANASESLELTPRISIQTRDETFRLDEANQALERLRSGDIVGSAVLELT